MTRFRLLALYVRSRGVPRAVPVLLAVTLVAASDVATFEFRYTLVSLSVAIVAAVLIGSGLGSPSPEIDAAAALPWWRWRSVHVLAATAVCAAVLALAVAYHYGTGVAGVVDMATVRAVVGFVGLAALAAVACGASLSWTVPSFYALAVVVFSPRSLPVLRSWDGVAFFRWPVQPASADLFWWPAIALFALGAVLYAVRGAADRVSERL